MCQLPCTVSCLLAAGPAVCGGLNWPPLEAAAKEWQPFVPAADDSLSDSL